MRVEQGTTIELDVEGQCVEVRLTCFCRGRRERRWGRTAERGGDDDAWQSRGEVESDLASRGGGDVLDRGERGW